MCRQETNDVPEKVNEKMRVVREKIALNPSLSKEERKVNTKEICDLVMSVHCQLQFWEGWETFGVVFFKKVEEFSTHGMDGEKLRKQVASFNSRIAPCPV
jgi:hypothetical protein